MEFKPTVVVAVLVAAVAVQAGSDDRVDELPEQHKKWLTEEVVYIIAERERDVFLSLESMDERERFIDAFWRRRDPNPATPVNEFKEEHERRLAHANTMLGRETYLEGWQTDRGRYYILLGEPREIQRFEGYGEIVSSELWFYQSEPHLGLPSFFYLLFFKENNLGDYRIYSPAVDTPTALFSAGGTFMSGADNIEAVNALDRISPELAAASLSFDVSDPPDFVSGRPALGTEILLSRIAEAPKRAVRTDYAETWLRDRGRVSAEYSFNFVPSRSVFAVLADASGTALVHYNVEIDPQYFSLETDEQKSKFYTTLDLTVEARSTDGVLVMANDSEAYIELTPSQMQTIYANPFAYQNNFPLLPGDYTVSVILRNRVLHQYTVAERQIYVPELSETSPAITDVVAAFGARVVPGELGDGAVRTFQVGNVQLQPATDRAFVLSDTVHAVAQAFGATGEYRGFLQIRDGDEVLVSAESAVGANGFVYSQLPLQGLAGGTYQVAARVVSPDGAAVLEKATEITVSPRTSASRPVFVLTRGIDTRIPGLLSFLLGEQYWNLARFDEAERAFSDAVASGNPQLVPARWRLASVYLRREEPDRALELLSPLEEAFPEQFDVLAGIGLAAHLKNEDARAVDYLERARKLHPPDTILLNALGESHHRLGNDASAREAFERSLGLDPEQPAIEEALKALPPTGG